MTTTPDPSSRPVTRRQFLVGVSAAAAAAAFLAACGGDPDNEDAPGASTPTGTATGTGTAAATATEAASSGGYPVTVAHKYGETTLEAAPQRVVSVGYRDHEHLLAFGVRPVAVRDWFGPVVEYATFPWAEEALGDATPVVLGAGELDFEQIAALQPDFICGLYSGMSQDEYDRLSQIAPTLPQSGDYVDWGMPWEEETRMIGAVLAQPERAEQMIAGVEQQIADARAAHPEFEGKRIVVAQLDTPGTFWVLGPQDFKLRFFTSLGFVLPDEIAEVVGDASNAAISEEQLHLLDQDVLAWIVGATWDGAPAAIEALEGSPLYQQIDVVREERDLFIAEPADALAWSSALSLPFAIEGIVPLLADAVARLDA